MRARLTSRALLDLDEIVECINRDNPAAADRFLERINDMGTKLAASSDMGFVHADLPTGVRYWPIGRYVIFYRATESETLILRVIHGSRDWSVLMQEPS